jgi:hypothetical protein
VITRAAPHPGACDRVVNAVSRAVTAHHQLTATLAQDYRFTAGPGGVPATTRSCGTGPRIADLALTVHRPCAFQIIIPGQPGPAPGRSMRGMAGA